MSGLVSGVASGVALVEAGGVGESALPGDARGDRSLSVKGDGKSSCAAKLGNESHSWELGLSRSFSMPKKSGGLMMRRGLSGPVT